MLLRFRRALAVCATAIALVATGFTSIANADGGGAIRTQAPAPANKAPIIRSEDGSEGTVTSYFAFEWTKSNSDYTTLTRDKVLTSFSSNASYPALIDINPKGVGTYSANAVQIRIPTKGLVARDGTLTGGVLTGIIPEKGSEAATADADYVYYYDGDTLVIENNKQLNRESHLRIPIEYRLAQYTGTNGNLTNKGFGDYVDGSRAEFTVEIVTPEGSDTSNAISVELDTSVSVHLDTYDASSGNKNIEELLPKQDWVWNVRRVNAYNYYGTQNATFDKIVFAFTEETLEKWPHIYFDTMPVNESRYDVAFSANKQQVVITCKDAAACTTIAGNADFRVVLPASDYDLSEPTGKLTPQYTVTTNATPVDGVDPVKNLVNTKTLTLQWHTPATPTPTPTPTRKEEVDNSYTAIVSHERYKWNGTKRNAAMGQPQRTYDLNALHGGEDQYQSYNINADFISSNATTRLAGAMPTMSISSSTSGAVEAGQSVTYKATLNNNKTYDSRQVAFEIPFPAGMTVDPGALAFTVNGADYAMPVANIAWDEENRILTIKNVPAISPNASFTATIPATATSHVNAGFGVLQMDQSSVNGNQNCGKATECVMVVRNTGSASTPEGVPFEMSFVSPANSGFRNKEFTSIKLNGSPVDIRTEFSGGKNGVAYLPALAPGDEITFTFNRDSGADAEPSMVRGKFGSLTLLPLPEDKIAPTSTRPYVMVGALQKDVQKNYQKRPFVFETIDTGLNFMQSAGAAGCTNTYGSVYWNCRLSSDDANIHTVNIGESKPKYFETTTHSESIVKLYGAADSAQPAWVHYATLHFTYHTTKPTTDTGGSGAGYYLTSVEYFNGASVGASGKATEIKLPSGVVSTRIVKTGHIYKMKTIVHTVLFADGPRVKARLDGLFEGNPYPSNQYVYNDVFQLTYDLADAPADGSIPSKDKLMERQSLTKNTLPPYLSSDPAVNETGNVSDFSYSTVMLKAEPERTGFLRHSIREEQYSATMKQGGAAFDIDNGLGVKSSLGYGYGANCLYKKNTESGAWQKIKGVRFYSLQPLGVRVNKDSVRKNEEQYDAFAGMDIKDVQIVENWRGSGRQMLIVEVTNIYNYTEPAECATGENVGYQGNDFIEESWIRWNADYTNVSYYTYGATLQRLDAAEFLVDDDALYRYDDPKRNAKGNKDRGVTLEGANTAPVDWSEASRELMDMLGGDDSQKKYLYDYQRLNLPQNPTLASDFKKYVARAGDSYALESWVNPSDEYTYQLAYANVSRTSQKNIVFYDSLENESGENTNRFHGTMTGLSFPAITASGVAPKVYYSTVKNVDVTSASSTQLDLSDTAVWTPIADSELAGFDWSRATAFAVDCSEKADGSEFQLARDAWLSLDVFMKAPDDAATKALLSDANPSAWAYNKSYAHVLVPDETLESGAPKDGTTWSTSVKPSTLATLGLHRSVFTPQATKELTGHGLADGQFSFELKKAGSDEVLATGTNKANGSVTFTPFEVTSADIGEATYEVTEINDGKPGYTYDEEVKIVTVTVVDAGGGQVTILGDSEDNWPTFTNAYHATGTITVTGEKQVRGTLLGPDAPELRGGEFEFTLFDANGAEVATATNNADGTITFPSINVTEANIGQSKFTVRETGECPFEWECATNAESVTVTVTDNDDGTLTATASGTPTFTNVYKPVTPTGISSGTIGGYLFLIAFGALGGLASLVVLRKRRSSLR